MSIYLLIFFVTGPFPQELVCNSTVRGSMLQSTCPSCMGWKIPFKPSSHPLLVVLSFSFSLPTVFHSFLSFLSYCLFASFSSSVLFL